MALRSNNAFPIVTAAPPPGAPLTSQNLAIAHVEQEKSEWCWAACTQMVLTSFGQQVEQCEVASVLFPDCCDRADDDDTCNQTCEREDILTVYENFNVTATFVEDSDEIVFADIRSEIRDRGRPVQVCIHWHEGGAHVLVIFGWRVKGSFRFLRIHDSLKNGFGEIRISQLREYEDQGDWTFTWIGFEGI